MSMTRRTFLLATGVSMLPWTASGGMAAPNATWVIDEALPQSPALIRRARLTGARIASLSGDAGWLWFERLSSLQAIGGLTRCADAFVLTQLGTETGMRATRRTLDGHALLWTLER
jgi:hypothetical protein